MCFLFSVFLDILLNHLLYHLGLKTYEPAHDKTYNRTCATSEDSDHMLAMGRAIETNVSDFIYNFFRVYANSDGSDQQGKQKSKMLRLEIKNT